MTNTKLFTSVDQIPLEWDGFIPEDLFLKRHYLKALEGACPENFKLYFLLIYNDGSLTGVAVVQHIKLYLQDIFRKNTGNLLVRLFRKGVSSVVKGNILVVGNLTHTGQHGIYFNPDTITGEVFLQQINFGLGEISKNIRKEQNKKVRLYLYKDFFCTKPLINDTECLQQQRLYCVKVQPNMILSIRNKWATIDDYYTDLNKKYKRRYRTALKKLGDVVEIELDENEIKANSQTLNSLYQNVSDHAKLNMFILPINHFCTLKKHLKDDFKLFAFYLNNEIIGFYSLILNHKNLETYFLGYDPRFQYDRHLYLNMLYKMLKFGIENSFEHIVYARTAMEIKSSIGAEPKEMLMYIKHTSPIVNKYLKPIFDLLDPTEVWLERHPFD